MKIFSAYGHSFARSLLYILFIWASTAYAQELPRSLDSMLHYTLDSAQGAMKVTSLSAAIQISSTQQWRGSAGISSLNLPEQVTPEHVYLYGSIAKTMTSACILQLAEEKKLSIDDSLHRWLDSMEYINPTITIHQLLQHRSGIYDVLKNPDCMPTLWAYPQSLVSADELIASFIKPPDFAPGAKWDYSNTNYFLLGMIIEKVTGNPYYKELRKRFFTPLGLNSIAMPAYEEVTHPVAHVWMDIDGDKVVDDAHGIYFPNIALNSAGGAAGGYYGTPADVAHWMRSYMRGDVIAPALMTEAKKTVAAIQSQGVSYGLGLMKKSFYGFEAYGHGGDLGYAASAWYFPSRDISISVCDNDSRFNSWTLAPVVGALLKTYNAWLSTVSDVASEKYAKAQTTAYPNPFSENLTISLNLPQGADKVQIQVCNLLGIPLVQSEWDAVVAAERTLFTVNTETITPGAYFLTVSLNGNKIHSQTLLK